MTISLLSIRGGLNVLLPELKRLGETVPGDVFYLAGDPSRVWFRDTPGGGYDGYTFALLAAEDGWRTQNEVDLPEAGVVVVHNTMAHLAETVADSGGG